MKLKKICAGLYEGPNGERIERGEPGSTTAREWVVSHNGVVLDPLPRLRDARAACVKMGRTLTSVLAPGPWPGRAATGSHTPLKRSST